jgi:calmodulin
MNPTDDDIMKMICHIDVNGDGHIAVDEFFKLIASYRAQEPESLETEEGILAGFKVVEGEEPGFITAKDVTAMFSNIGEWISLDQAHDMIRIADMDRDGKLNYEEFNNLMKGVY